MAIQSSCAHVPDELWPFEKPKRVEPELSYSDIVASECNRSTRHFQDPYTSMHPQQVINMPYREYRDWRYDRDGVR